MSNIKLETVRQLKADRIRQSQIIQKCRDIAQQLGEGGNTSENYANALYRFGDDVVHIRYDVFAMGDQELMVFSDEFSDEKRVLVAVERVNRPCLNPLQVVIDGRRFDVADYTPGIWEQRVEELYQRLSIHISLDSCALR